jgi:radical SAM superfamily enzyme YgiQ (UPF0313 family)
MTKTDFFNRLLIFDTWLFKSKNYIINLKRVFSLGSLERWVVLTMAKIAFIQSLFFELAGIQSLSALLKINGHTVDLFIDTEKNIINSLKAFKPDICGFSCLTEDYLWISKISNAIKNTPELRKTLIIIGGPHPTFYPEVIEEDPNIDIICIGEGEYAMQELADTIDKGGDYTNIQNLWVKRNGNIYKNKVRPLIDDLDSIPPFDRDLHFKYKHLRNKPFKYFFAGRGCPYKCTYCLNHAIRDIYKNKGRYIRYRKAESVIKEIKYIKSIVLKVVCFADDIFILDRKWSLNFLTLYKKEVNLPFRCNIFINLVDEEIVSALKDAGCNYVMFGIESGNEEIRKRILHKYISDEVIIKVSQLLHKYKINFSTSNMFGFPGETLENALETIKLNARIHPTTTWASVFQPYPKMDITEYAIRNNYLDPQDLKKKAYDSFLDSPIKGNDIKKIFNLHKFSLITIKLPWLLPLVKLLIKLPPNKLFYYIYALSYGWHYWKRTGYNFIGMFSEGIFILKNRLTIFRRR